MNTYRTSAGGFDKRAIMLGAWEDFRAMRRDCSDWTFAQSLKAVWARAKRTEAPAITTARFDLMALEAKERGITDADRAKIRALNAAIYQLTDLPVNRITIVA